MVNWCLRLFLVVTIVGGRALADGGPEVPTANEFLRMSMKERHSVFAQLDLREQVALHCVAYQRLHPMDLGLTEILAARRRERELVAMAEKNDPQSCRAATQFVLTWMIQRGFLTESDLSAVKESLPPESR